MMNSLHGMVAIITGGGQGVGLGIAEALGEAGASIVITGRDGAKLNEVVHKIRAAGAPEVLTVPGDVRRRECAKETVTAVIEKFGRLDVLVNNAQTAWPGTLFEDYDDEKIGLTWESGFLGTLHFMQESLPYLKVRGGSIINLGSREGILGGKGHSLYAATKEAVRGMSRCVAREWGQHNIRVNVICPAAVTELATRCFATDPSLEQFYVSATSLGRLGDSRRDIGTVVAFLAGPDSAYVTGQTINIDGGQVML
jgi:NAD(P)-dependent dehydrogenase (short-subunit alcohol dehydrogenase family)